MPQLHFCLHTCVCLLTLYELCCICWQSLFLSEILRYRAQAMPHHCLFTVITAKVIHNLHTDTHTRLTAVFPGLPEWAATRKTKSIWILLKQETVSGSGVSWACTNSAPSSRQITMPAPCHLVFYRLDALPATQPTASKHWMPHIHIYIYSLPLHSHHYQGN